jgi:hypothetical protein
VSFCVHDDVRCWLGGVAWSRKLVTRPEIARAARHPESLFFSLPEPLLVVSSAFPNTWASLKLQGNQ